MRIWTIQSRAAWDSLKKHGVLRASREHQDDSWPDAYGWIEGQLIKRVGPPPGEGAVPLWGWYQCHDAGRKRPDLRTFRYAHAPGEYVLIECELPEAGVMLSDFDAWHIALNGQYLELTDEERDSYLADRERYDAAPNEQLHEDLRRRFYGSWERMIDMDVLTEPDWHTMEKKSIQACFWQLDLDQVKSFKLFRAVGSPRLYRSGSASSRSSTIAAGR